MGQEANIVIRLSDGKVAGETLKELKQDANRLTKEVSRLKPGTDEFIKKSADLKQVKGRLKDVGDQAFGVSKANNMAVESFLQYIPFGPQLGALAKGFNTVTGATRTFGMAMKAIPIFALIGLILSLVSWFKRTEEGAQKLRIVTAGLGQGLDSLMDIVTFLGKTIFETFSNPKKAVSDLWEFIKTNMINRVKGMVDTFRFAGKAISAALKFDWDAVKENAAAAGKSILQATTGIDDLPGKLKNGITSAIDTAKDLATELKNDALAAMDLAEKENNLRVKNREFLIEEAKYRTEIAKLREFATDVTRTDEERHQALAKAIELSNQVEDKKIALKREQLRILKAQQDISITDEAGLEEAARLEAELIKLQESRASSMRRLTSQESALRDKINKEEQKRLKDLQKYELELMEEGLEKKLKQLQIETEKKIEALTGSEEQIAEAKLMLQAIQKKEEDEIREEYRQEELEKEEAHRRAIEDLQIAVMDEGFDKELAALRAEHERKIADLQGSEEEKAALKLLLTEQQLQQEDALRDKYRKIQEQKDKEEREKKIEGIMEFSSSALQLVEDFHQNEIDSQQAKVDTAKELYGEDSRQYKDAQEELVKTKKKVGEKIKAAQITEAIINGVAEIAGYWKAYSAIPVAGPIIAAALTAVAVGRTALNISKIKQQTFEKGGILRGARHAQGGIPGYVSSTRTPVEMEDYEIVLTRNVGLSPVGRAMASRLNEMFGGKKFATGGPVNPFTPPDTTSTRASTVFSSPDMSETNDRIDGITNELRMLREDLSTWQRELKVVNNLQETQEGLATLNRLEDSSGI